jgi:hypothetical protein
MYRLYKIGVMKRLLFFFLFFVSSSLVSAQEFNCTVQIISPQLQSSDKKIFETLQNAIRDFINNRKWSDDFFLNQEKIECTIIMNISERPTSDAFKGTIQIISRRPVFKTSYNTILFDFLDQDLNFKYIEDQTLDYVENSNASGLTSIVAYYCYIMLGLDYDSFALEGGNLFLQKAQNIVNISQNNSEPGWKAFEGTRNRYWLSENLLVPLFKPMREVYYKYNRKGMDVLSVDPVGGRKEIIECLELLKKVAIQRPNSLLMQIFFNAKSDEIVNIFSQAASDEKFKVTTLLNEIDPSNTTKYLKIGK